MTESLENMFRKSLKYYREKGLALGQKYADSRGKGARRPSDFWLTSKAAFHHIECKQVTSYDSFYFDFDRLYGTGQYDRMREFWCFSKLHQAWVIINFKNRRLRVDKYYILHISDFDRVVRWVNKGSIRLDEIEYYNRFEFPEINAKMYIDGDFTKVKYKYNMVLEKISVEGVKGKILDLDTAFRLDITKNYDEYLCEIGVV